MVNDLLASVKLRQLHVNDAKLLRDNGLLHGNLQAIETKIRSLISSDYIHSYIYINNEAISLIRISKIDEQSSNYCLYITYNDSASDDLSNVINDAIVVSFFKLCARKVSVKVECSNLVFEEALVSNGFIQEAVLHEEYFVDGQYVDAGLFYLLRPQYSKYNYLFLPFPRGVVFIGGGKDYVDQVGFLNYEQKIEDVFMADSAEFLGICDGEGVLYKRNYDCYSYDFSEIPYIPSEVNKAYLELIEYFLKKRQVFDINILLRDLTQFQLDVLEVLKTIPYGSTCSYEDIALKLTNNDFSRARKLTRAVGNACSSNPVPIIIPCHRVIGKNGMLVGFSGGIEFKDFLLQNEMFESMIPLN